MIVALTGSILFLSLPSSKVCFVGVSVVVLHYGHYLLSTQLQLVMSCFNMATPLGAAGTSNEMLFATIKDVETQMNEQMTSMKRELMQEREQVDEWLVK